MWRYWLGSFEALHDWIESESAVAVSVVEANMLHALCTFPWQVDDDSVAAVTRLLLSLQPASCVAALTPPALASPCSGNIEYMYLPDWLLRPLKFWPPPADVLNDCTMSGRGMAIAAAPLPFTRASFSGRL